MERLVHRKLDNAFVKTVGKVDNAIDLVAEISMDRIAKKNVTVTTMRLAILKTVNKFRCFSLLHV